MKNVVLTCCRDEEDIIATFIDFYLEMGFDEIYVVDNGSVDDTPIIIEMMNYQGKPVYLKRDPRLGYERHLEEYYLWVGRLAIPNWIFFIDCDEFILFPTDAKKYLSAIAPVVNCLRLRQREMLPLPVTPGETVPLESFLLTTRTEPTFNDTTKDVTRFHPQARIYAGKHKIELPNKHEIVPQDLFIRHYKYRNIAQAQSKEVNRIQAHGSYSVKDLTRISAFGVEESLEWFEICRENANLEAWKSNFVVKEDDAVDSEMRNWAEKFLLKEN